MLTIILAASIAATPSDDGFISSSPPPKPLAAVIEKLQELNPGFDGKASHRIEKGRITGLSLSTATITDLAPLRTLRDLRDLRCPGSDKKRTLADLAPLRGLPLTNLLSWTDKRETAWRNHRPKNRMREICASGSVRGLGGNAQGYSETTEPSPINTPPALPAAVSSNKSALARSRPPWCRWPPIRAQRTPRRPRHRLKKFRRAGARRPLSRIGRARSASKSP